MHKKNYIGLIIIFIFIFTFSINQRIYAQNFPKPEGFVNDFANLIDSETKQNLTKLAVIVKQNTGSEIAIVTIDNIGNYSIEEYAADLFKKWGIGEKGKDNGILILLALKQRKVRIEVGYGLEGDFPDILANKYLEDYAIPYFKKGDYSKGFYALTYAIVNRFAKINNADINQWLETANVPKVKIKSKNSFSISSLFNLLFILFFFVFPIAGAFGRRYFYSRRASNPLLWAMFFGGINSGRHRSGFNNNDFGGFSGFGGFGGFGGGSSGGGGATGSF